MNDQARSNTTIVVAILLLVVGMILAVLFAANSIKQQFQEPPPTRVVTSENSGGIDPKITHYLVLTQDIDSEKKMWDSLPDIVRFLHSEVYCVGFPGCTKDAPEVYVPDTWNHYLAYLGLPPDEPTMNVETVVATSHHGFNTILFNKNFKSLRRSRDILNNTSTTSPLVSGLSWKSVTYELTVIIFEEIYHLDVSSEEKFDRAIVFEDLSGYRFTQAFGLGFVTDGGYRISIIEEATAVYISRWLATEKLGLRNEDPSSFYGRELGWAKANVFSDLSPVEVVEYHRRSNLLEFLKKIYGTDDVELAINRFATDFSQTKN